MMEEEEEEEEEEQVKAMEDQTNLAENPTYL